MLKLYKERRLLRCLFTSRLSFEIDSFIGEPLPERLLIRLETICSDISANYRSHNSLFSFSFLLIILVFFIKYRFIAVDGQAYNMVVIYLPA